MPGPTRRAALLLAALFLAVAVGGACSKEKKQAAPPTTSSSTTTTLPEFKLVVASVDVQAMKYEPAALTDADRAQITATLSSYLEKAIVEPLRTGQPPVGLDAVFTPVALARLTPGTPDRAAMVDDPPGVGTGAVAPEKADVSLTALANQHGNVDVVNAAIDFSVLVTTPTGQVRVARRGDVVLMPVPGGWRIDSYDVVTKRDTVPPPAPSTTTTTTGTGK